MSFIKKWRYSNQQYKSSLNMMFLVLFVCMYNVHSSVVCLQLQLVRTIQYISTICTVDQHGRGSIPCSCRVNLSVTGTTSRPHNNNKNNKNVFNLILVAYINTAHFFSLNQLIIFSSITYVFCFYLIVATMRSYIKEQFRGKRTRKNLLKRFASNMLHQALI